MARGLFVDLDETKKAIHSCADHRCMNDTRTGRTAMVTVGVIESPLSMVRAHKTNSEGNDMA